VTDKPVRTLINTHHHIDHTLGNALFPEARIIAHANARREQERVGRSVFELLRPRIPELVAEAEDVELRFPDETFEGGETRLTVGEREARLLHLGPGHTMGDVLVYLPGDRLLFAGDVAFHYVTPLGLEGHLGNWAAVCDAVLEMDVERIVPGHGPVGGKEDLRAMQGYLRSVHGQARAAFDEGVPAEEASRRVDLGEYASWPEAERLPLNLNRCYQEFRGET
jgi:cyclase